MGLILSRSVMIHISNKTRNVTLKNPRTYFDCGQCPAPLLPELSPGSSDASNFPSKFPFWGVAGVVVYEAESFTLAIHFSNSIDYKFTTELGLELSPGKAHLGSLEDTYTRMANGAYSSSDADIKFSRAVIVDRSHGTVQVSHGHVKVTATMSDTADSILRVVLEEEEGIGGGSWDREPPWSKTLPGKVRTIRTFFGRSWTALELHGQPEIPADISRTPQAPLEHCNHI